MKKRTEEHKALLGLLDKMTGLDIVKVWIYARTLYALHQPD